MVRQRLREAAYGIQTYRCAGGIVGIGDVEDGATVGDGVDEAIDVMREGRVLDQSHIGSRRTGENGRECVAQTPGHERAPGLQAARCEVAHDVHRTGATDNAVLVESVTVGKRPLQCRIVLVVVPVDFATRLTRSLDRLRTGRKGRFVETQLNHVSGGLAGNIRRHLPNRASHREGHGFGQALCTREPEPVAASTKGSLPRMASP